MENTDICFPCNYCIPCLPVRSPPRRTKEGIPRIPSIWYYQNMVSRMQRMWTSLDLEERIINGAALFALISVFFPWMSGEWLGGDVVTYSGFSSYTSIIGMAIFLLLLAIVLT